MNVPAHLNEIFFENIIRRNFKLKSFQLREISFSPGSEKGVNYSGQIYRVQIPFFDNDEAQERILSVIIKVLPKSPYNDLIKVYENEVHIYEDIFPHISQIVPGLKIAAKFYYATRDPFETIVLEDLKSLHYRHGNRQKGFDEKHAKLVLEKIGKFHAASMILYEKHPELLDYFTVSVFREEFVQEPCFNSLYRGNLEYLIPIVASWSGYEVIAEKLKIVAHTLIRRSVEESKQKEGEIRVLNHDDLWANNIMFQYNNTDSTISEPLDAVFVDYQVCFFSSPGIDINFFFCTSVQLDILKNKRDELIKIYYKSLVETLHENSYVNIPTEEAIRKEIHDREFFGFIACLADFPIICMDENHCIEDIAIFEDKEKIDEKRNIMFSTERCQETLKYLLKRYDELGIFG